MTDDEFAAHCRLTVEQVKTLDPAFRARVEHMIDVGERLARGEKVEGVLVDRARPRRREAPLPLKRRRR